MDFVVKPMAYVRNSRATPSDDFWGSIVSDIELADGVPSVALAGIGTFSHVEVIFLFDKVDPADTVWSGRPRGNPAWPPAGIFAQRKKNRPNRIGLSTAELVGYSDRKIVVRYLDAIDGTPVLDIKPVYREFQPRTPIRQPLWAEELMREYWLEAGAPTAKLRLNDYIVLHPNVMAGKPFVKGTRVTVEQVLEELSVAGSIDKVLTAHPQLTKEQVRAALAFAAKSIYVET